MKMEKNWVVSAIILLLIGIVGTIVFGALDCSDGKMECIYGKLFGLGFSISFVGVALVIFLYEGIYDYCKKRVERF